MTNYPEVKSFHKIKKQGSVLSKSLKMLANLRQLADPAKRNYVSKLLRTNTMG